MKKMTMCKIESHLLKGFYMRSQDKLQLDQMYLNYKKNLFFYHEIIDENHYQICRISKSMITKEVTYKY